MERKWEHMKETVCRQETCDKTVKQRGVTKGGGEMKKCGGRKNKYCMNV
jgi:hypothetical protein